MTILGSHNEIKGVQSTKRDQLDYLQLMKERQVKAYRLVVESDRLTKEKHRANNEQIDNTITKRPAFEVGNWVWIYDVQHTLSTATGDPKLDKNAIQQRIKAKLANKWTGPFKVLGVGPGEVEGKMVGAKLLYLDLPHDNKTNPRVSVLRCKRCLRPHEKDDRPEFLPWELCSYVMHKFAQLAPPFYLTAEDVEIELDVERAQPVKTNAHRISRGPGGTSDVQFETLWKGHQKPTWEAEQSLYQYGDVARQYWQSNEVEQVGANNKHHRDYPKMVPLRAAARARNSVYLPAGYALRKVPDGGPELRSVEMKGAHIFLRTEAEGWQLGVIHGVSRKLGEPRPYNVNFVDLNLRY